MMFVMRIRHTSFDCDWSSDVSFSMHIMRDYFFFFFSSRRRHTRSDRDWSSDVCSSDLASFHRPFLILHLSSTHHSQLLLRYPQYNYLPANYRDDSLLKYHHWYYAYEIGRASCRERV